MIFEGLGDCRKLLKGVLGLDGQGGMAILDEGRLREEVIDGLIYNAVFHPNAEIQRALRSLIRRVGDSLGAPLASIHALYMAMGRGEVGGFTVPAINLRGLTYDSARALFRAAIRQEVGALILEIARSEMSYTWQRPAEYSACIVAAAVREGYLGPLFLQGDHFQVSREKFAEDPERELHSLRALIGEAIEAGFYHIDIDSSTLADLGRPGVREQQRPNFECAAELTAHVRRLEPEGVITSVGGEVGEVGGRNTTVEEAEAFLKGYRETLMGLGRDLVGLSKLSIQTGTTHGGVPLPDGTVAQVRLDFETLEKISRLVREKYGLSGAVQHGASTLPEELFDRFPQAGASEIHLATAFQNLLYETLPAGLREAMYAWLRKERASERKGGETEEQFLYKTRKRAFGPFKRALWDLPEASRAAIRKELEGRFSLLFEKLRVEHTRGVVDRYIEAQEMRGPIEEGLQAVLRG